MENTQQSSSFNDLFDLRIDAEAQQLLFDCAKWAKIIAVFSFISIGVSMISPFVIYARVDMVPMARTFAIGGGVMSALISGLITVAINIFLYRFSNYTVQGLNNNDQETFNKGVNNLRIYSKIIGIIMIIVLSLLTLVFFLFLLIGGIAAMVSTMPK
ncbi:MAG: hypothetical protein P0Y53_13215 [Candidatus Pseudobacter hemicellulosilyticus]|uniref:Uncharacterized protein n=1 Tax=Candidatus Pseudobacter hemicellulosilyticus TaxID=3121375 RepID=A0AAJ5WMP3_9BACT|nr:MAG: hypothetical protein P0Y53_13215 [Pseudobacter sp.]